ncbi:RidA family protein [Pseudorhodoplanes sp.]|uniref:RidA family protein n=1 Tax=Pseudorhodoplanes sp. TaxID=1934341 RepID=UPI003D0B318B
MSDTAVRTPATNIVLNPPGWPQPRGYANGVKARGEMVFVGGMIGWDIHGKLPDGFVAQTKQLLENIVAVLKEGGAGPEHVVRMTWYVTDMDAYRNSLPELGKVYREIMGRNFGAMALVQVMSLVERGALLEIETTAVVPD